MTIQADIARTKKRLIAEAKRQGLWENFGQKEVRHLKYQYSYSVLIYGDADDQAKAALIDDFDDWCMNYTGEV